MDEEVDVIIPRGGEGLIRFVTEHSRVPVLKHYKGVCHIYVDQSASLKNGSGHLLSMQRSNGPASAMPWKPCWFIRKLRLRFSFPKWASNMKRPVLKSGDAPKRVALVPGAVAATESDWPAEFLDLILAVKVVGSMDEALDHIETYGSQHTEAIITNEYDRALRFLAQVDSSVVLVNASTRFNDGNQLGLGAEIGINTSKLHAFGPMGLEELTTTKFVVYGQGQIRN